MRSNRFKDARILVVDDNPATLYSTSRVLREAGWEVVEAQTGRTALDLVPSVDLAILDVNLPDIDGFEICRTIRASETLSRVAVIHLSATFVGDSDKVEGLEAGADAYLVQPIEPPVLIATVRAFLRARYAEARVEQALLSERTARAEAEEANRVKDEFLAVLSHELRTPLNAIAGWTQVMQIYQERHPDLAEGIQAIERSTNTLTRMIEDLLDISRIISGKMNVVMEPVDLAAIVDSVIDAVMPIARSKHIRISKDVSIPRGTVQGDPTRLTQVVSNVVNNAVKFTPAGGAVNIVLVERETDVELSVSDTGKGISKEFLPIVFDRFRQGDPSTSREYSGLGLGLSLAHQFVELHGGSIVADSPGAGLGATFRISLPLSGTRQQASVPQATPPRLRDSHPIQNVRVLVVDDEADARKSLRRLLEQYGAHVEDANGVDSALKMLGTFKPHVLVSDIAMPGRDGIEFISVVRQLGYDEHSLPAIALTAFAKANDASRVLAAGYQQHVAKPANVDDLVKLVRSLVKHEAPQ